MKRSPMIVILVVLLCLTVIPVSALEAGVTIQSTAASVGELVYLPLSLEETQEANTVGIDLSFDRSALEFVASQSTWSISGSIRNFDRQREYALWADSRTRSLNGELCRLAFRVKAGAKPSQCSVTCSVVLSIDTQEVASYTATGEITLQCQHSYGAWTELDANAHRRVCQLCGSEEFGAHEWDKGAVTKEATLTQPGTRVFTCQLCGAEREESIPVSGSQETAPPTDTSPGQPGTTLPQTPQSTQPAGPQSTQPAQSGSTQSGSTQSQTSQPAQSGSQSDNPGSGTTSAFPVESGGADESAQESQPLVVSEEDVVVIRPSDAAEEPAGTPEAAEEPLPAAAESAEETQPAAEPEKPAWIGAAVIACLLAAAGGLVLWLVKRQKP